MRDLLPELMAWWEAGEPVGVATVVDTIRSAPRQPGATMLVGPDGTVVGSISGGCVEGATYEQCQHVLASGRPTLHRYGVSDAEFEVGLTCGGTLDVFVEKVDQHTFPDLGAVAADVRAARPVAVATVVTHPDPELLGRHLVVRPDAVSGTLGNNRLDAAVATDAQGMMITGVDATMSYGVDGQRLDADIGVYIRVLAAQPRLLIFGAIDFASALAKVGAFLGYHVTVCDARSLFATKARFPQADEVVVDWPHRFLAKEAAAGRLDARTVVTVLTHDPKFDVPALEVALRLPDLAYVGAMGSRRTHEDRLRRLKEAGLSDDELSGLHSPIGLDLGARTPEETAISIAAEFTADRWGGSGQRLRLTSGAIHSPPPSERVS